MAGGDYAFLEVRSGGMQGVEPGWLGELQPAKFFLFSKNRMKSNKADAILYPIETVFDAIKVITLKKRMKMENLFDLLLKFSCNKRILYDWRRVSFLDSSALDCCP